MWTSSNSAIANVTGNSSQGKVTGVSVGTATITHTYDSYWNGTQTDTWNVAVVAKEYTIKFDKNDGSGSLPNSIRATAVIGIFQEFFGKTSHDARLKFGG